MAVQMLTTEELAEIKGVSPQYIRKLAKIGKIECDISFNEKNKPKYLYDPYVVLDAKEQLSFIKTIVSPSATSSHNTDNYSKPLDHFSEKERSEMAYWIDTVEKWQRYRNAPNVKKKTDVDELFVASIKLEHPDIDISVDTLYRRWKAYKEKNWEALVDNRGKHRKGQSKVTKEMMDAMLYYFFG